VNTRELNVDLLLSRRVYALNGRRVGHLEEVRAERRGGEYYVTEYFVGVYALFARLAGWFIGQAILEALGVKSKRRGFRVPWNQLDLTDPGKPRLKCPVADLEPIEDDA
jgi:hypothetical protein